MGYLIAIIVAKLFWLGLYLWLFLGHHCQTPCCMVGPPSCSPPTQGYINLVRDWPQSFYSLMEKLVIPLCLAFSIFLFHLDASNIWHEGNQIANFLANLDNHLSLAITWFMAFYSLSIYLLLLMLVPLSLYIHSLGFWFSLQLPKRTTKMFSNQGLRAIGTRHANQTKKFDCSKNLIKKREHRPDATIVTSMVYHTA